MAEIKIYGQLKAQTEEGIVTDSGSVDDSSSQKKFVPPYSEETFTFVLKNGTTVTKTFFIKTTS